MSMGKKVALITGAGRGIGLGIARCLASNGFDIVVDDIHDAEVVKEALDSLRVVGAEVLYVQADISKAAERERLIAEIKGRFGRLDVLVNNAGVAPKVRSTILEASEESFDRLMTINLKGPYFLTQIVAKWMIEQSKADADHYSPSIINMSSISSTVASPNRGDYCISKAGVSMATKLWASALAEYGISVYEIRPGIIESDMTAGVKEKYDKLIAEGLTVEPRWGTPHDIGKAVATLARGEISYATGQVLVIDGGLTLQRL